MNDFLLPTYAREPVELVRGDGVWVEDADGRRYLDFAAGIAVVGLGHRHPAVTAAAHAQLDRLWHVSNLYWTQPMAGLARRLSERFGGAQAFFCNSGAESVEAALKYAREATGRAGIVALEGSFHGRTLGALSITGQAGKRAPFEPLVPGVVFARAGDVASLRDACAGEPPACIVLEPVQGEGGVHPLTPEFAAAAADLADACGALLILDEVQTGIGRTGSFFAFEQLGVRPHAVTLAKALANGLPIGCLLVSDDAPRGFAPGDHASTFGGNPVACAAACAVLDAVDDGLLAALRVGAELDRPAGDVVAACRERGLLVLSAGPQVLRLTPPLMVTAADVDRALATLADALAASSLERSDVK